MKSRKQIPTKLPGMYAGIEEEYLFENVMLNEVDRRGLRAKFFHVRNDLGQKSTFAYDKWAKILRGCIVKALQQQQIKPYAYVDGNPVVVNAIFGCNAITKCTLETGDGAEVAAGYAFCTDNFCRLTGRVHALERALKMEASKE